MTRNLPKGDLVEVVAQQIRQRQSGRGLGDRGTREDERAAGAIGVRELSEEARFAYPRFADHRDDLAMDSAHEFEGVLETVHFPVPADEASTQPSSRNRSRNAWMNGIAGLVGSCA